MNLINDGECQEDRTDFVECRACERTVPIWDVVQIMDDEFRKCVCCDCVTLHYTNDEDCTPSHAAELALSGTKNHPPRKSFASQKLTKRVA